MVCKFRVYDRQVSNNNELRSTLYTCAEVKSNQQKWKEDFRTKNDTDRLIRLTGQDRKYDDYCKDIDDFIAQCKCKSVLHKG